MKKLFIITLITLVGLCSCKRGRSSLRHILRPAHRAVNLSNEDDSQNSFSKDFTPKILSKEELSDSAEFKCYHVKIQLPQDTMCYLAFNRVGLPGLIDIETVSSAKVTADFYLHNDTANKINSATWFYKNGLP